MHAQMAELVDALASGASVRKDVQVRLLFWARNSLSNTRIYYPTVITCRL
jgi:hypothetical protein